MKWPKIDSFAMNLAHDAKKLDKVLIFWAEPCLRKVINKTTYLVHILAISVMIMTLKSQKYLKRKRTLKLLNIIFILILKTYILLELWMDQFQQKWDTICEIISSHMCGDEKEATKTFCLRFSEKKLETYLPFNLALIFSSLSSFRCLILHTKKTILFSWSTPSTFLKS